MFKNKKRKSEADILFQSSGKIMKNRVNPIDCITGFEPRKKSSFYEKLMFNYEKFLSDRYQKNNIKRIKKLNPIQLKEEAINAYSKYYKLIYVSKSANHKELLNLLSLYGSPDFENPYSTGSIEHSYYNECGFIANEIEAILNFMLFKNEYESFLVSEDVIEIVDEVDKYEKYKNYYNQAIISLCYIFYYGKSFEILKKNVNNDNIEMALIEAVINADFEDMPFSKNSFIEVVGNKGLIKKENIKIISNLKSKKNTGILN